MACEKCWADAYMRWMSNPEKDQAEHYRELLAERKDHPCTPEQQAGQMWPDDEVVEEFNRRDYERTLRRNH